VRINERICVKFAEISNNWNGGIRFGFTSNDPATLEGALPKYACPDLTNRPGFWAKALHEQYCEKDNILYYYVNNAGDVIYGINQFIVSALCDLHSLANLTMVEMTNLIATTDSFMTPA